MKKLCSKIVVMFDPPIDWDDSHEIARKIIRIDGVKRLKGVRVVQRKTAPTKDTESMGGE